MNLNDKFLKPFLRSFLNNKKVFIINFIGLIIGFVSFFLIANYILFENSYDRFHKNSENLYRLITYVYKGQEIDNIATPVANPLAQLLAKEFKEVENYCRYRRPGQNFGQCELTCGKIKIDESKITYVDTSFFNVFSYELISGNPQQALRHTNSLVISESLAKKYFEGEDPLNKMVQVVHATGTYNWRITGVMKDMPQNSSLQFNMIASMQCLYQMEPRSRPEANGWSYHAMYSFVVLKDGTNPREFEEKIQNIVEKRSYWVKLNKNLKFTYKLQPIKDVHFYSEGFMWGEIPRLGNLKYLIILFVASLFILFISYINYFLFQLNNVNKRYKEIGMKRIFGSNFFKLFKQFFAESFAINLIAIIISIIIIVILKPYFYSIYGLPISVFLFSDVISIIGLTILIMFILMTFAFYLAYTITLVNPLGNIKEKSIFKKGFLKITTQRLLVIIQLTITAILMICTSIIYYQINFLEEQSINADLDKVGRLMPVVNRDSTMYNRLNALITELSKLKEVEMTSVDNESPCNEVTWADVFSSYDNLSHSVSLSHMHMSPDFVPIFGIKVLSGRNFSKTLNETNSVILNEAAVDLMNFKNPKEAVGRFIQFYERKLKVVGVIQNYHTESVKLPYRAVLYFPNLVGNSYERLKYVHVKLKDGNKSEAVAKVKNVWNKIFPDKRATYEYLPDLAYQYYLEDRKIATIFSLFTFITLILSCIGIWGVSLYDVNKRVNEVAVRKVNGASVMQITILILRGILKYIAISLVLAAPIAYFIMNDWLQNFPVRTSMPWSIYLLVALVAIVVALFTSSFVIVKSARQKPIEVLCVE